MRKRMVSEGLLEEAAFLLRPKRICKLDQVQRIKGRVRILPSEDMVNAKDQRAHCI